MNPKETAETAEKIKALLSYDQETGSLIWKATGKVADIKTKKGYWQVWILSKKYISHRLCWLLHYGVWPEQFLDHRDTNKANNRIDNLRLTTKSQNNCNTHVRKSNKSGYKGVTYLKRENCYIARITLHRKATVLGYFKDPESASAAYAKAAIELHGEFARS